MRTAAVHLCFIDSGHISLNRFQVMRRALSKQSYDRRAPVDLHRAGAAEPPSLGPLAVGFVRPKKRAPSLSSKGSVLTSIMLASKKQRRAVWSVSSHTTHTGAALGVKKGLKKSGSCITCLIRFLQSSCPEKSQTLHQGDVENQLERLWAQRPR